MPTESEHASAIFSGILPHRKDLLEKAQARLRDEHFVEPLHKGMFTLLNHYYKVNSSVLSASALEDLTRKLDVGKRNLYREAFVAFSQAKVTDADFLWSLDQLRERVTEKKTLELLNESVEILTKGKTDNRGEVLQGAKDTKTYLSDGLASIDRELALQDAPEGNMRDERDEMLQEYQQNKQALLDGSSRGIEFGIPALDDKTGGMKNGELTLVAGYSNDGKSSFMVQIAHHCAVNQGKNVVIMTTETLRPQMRRKILARHSKMPIFQIPDGLNTRDLKRGSLSAELERKLEEVTTDLANNPEYGVIYIAQVPRNSSISEIEQHLYRLQSEFHIDLVVIDYLALLTSSKNRTTDREILSGIIKETKQVATTFNDGRGVPIISPWQVTRVARENAEKLGHYSSASLSETAEATNSPDLIISLLAPTDNTNRFAELTMQILKSRDSETANDILVDVDFATSCFTGKSSMASFGRAATLPTDGDGGLSSLLNG